MSSQLAPLTLISGGKVRGGASDVLKQAGFTLTDLGPFLRVICRAEDSWLACATRMAPPPAPPPTDPGSACLSLSQEIPCTTSVGSQRLAVFNAVLCSSTPPKAKPPPLDTNHLSLLYLTFRSSLHSPVSPPDSSLFSAAICKNKPCTGTRVIICLSLCFFHSTTTRVTKQCSTALSISLILGCFWTLFSPWPIIGSFQHKLRQWVEVRGSDVRKRNSKDWEAD